MGTTLPLLAALAVPVVQVDSDGIDDESARRTSAHVIERLLEAGIAVDPNADTLLTLRRTPTGYGIDLVLRDRSISSSELVAASEGAQLSQLEVVQVAVDMALAHAPGGEPPRDAVRVVAMPGAGSARAEVLAATMASGHAVMPASVTTTRVLCVDRREGETVVAVVADEAECGAALAQAELGATLELAIADALSPAEAEPASRPAVVVAPTKPAPLPKPAAPRLRWSLGGVIGLGFAWRPNAFDAAPTAGFVAASPRGLALAADAIFVPSHAEPLRALDTMLALGIGYRARLGARARLSVIPAAGLSVHGAWIDGVSTHARVDPLLLLPLHVEAQVHRNVAIGLRIGAGTTFRTRVHSVRGFELWRRGPLLVLALATVRFGS